jgi:hypothetical protein
MTKAMNKVRNALVDFFLSRWIWDFYMYILRISTLEADQISQ